MALSQKFVVPLAVGAVVLAVYAGWTLVEAGEEYETMARDAYIDADGRPVDARAEALERRRRLAAAARGVSVGDRRRQADPLLADDDVKAPKLELGALTQDDAEAGFDYAMRRVEKIADDRRRLKQPEWEELYREANDAFSAYSMYIDVSDADQALLLEEAHRRLKKGLRRVRVRGKKLAN